MKNNSVKGRGKRILCSMMAVFILLLSCSFVQDQGALDEVRANLKTSYVDVLPDSTLNQPTINDILKIINKTDPYTQYFTAKQYKDFVNSVNNIVVGIGVRVEADQKGVLVMSVIKGSPAEGAGLQAGDIITKADEHNLVGLELDKATSFIKGTENTYVTITVIRGNNTFTKKIVRKTIVAPTVISNVLDGHIGYIQIESFGLTTASLFGSSLEKLNNNKNVDSIVVDLRFNGGGYMDQAIDIAGYFCGDNPVLITRDRKSGVIKYIGGQHKIKVDKKTVFLINAYTASASEILSGAVRDYNKAYFIGTNSFGKGCVQAMITLKNGDGFKYTIQSFYSPKDKVIQKVGIAPNLKVDLKSDSLKIAQLLLNGNKNVKNTKGYVKLKLNDYGTAVLNINEARTKLGLSTYAQVLRDAAVQKGLMLGTGTGWTDLSKDANNPQLYYTNYEVIQKVAGVTANTGFRFDYGKKLKAASVNSKNVQLLDMASGQAVNASISLTNGSDITVMPTDNLRAGGAYFLTTNGLKDSKNHSEAATITPISVRK